MKIRILFSAIIATFISSAALHAANQWWNATTDANWDYTTNNWYDWNPGQSTFAAGDYARFEYDVAKTVTITSSVTTGGLNFSIGGFTITGGTLAFNNTATGGNPEIKVGTNTETIASYIDGSAATYGMFLYGTGGTLNLSGGGNFNSINQAETGEKLSLSAGIFGLSGGLGLSDASTLKFTIGSGVKLNVGGVLNLTHWNGISGPGTAQLPNNNILDFATTGTLSGDYVIASYGGLLGTFGSETNVPAGYTVDYAYHGLNEIALVQSVPEPSTWVTLLGGLGMLAMFRRRRA